LETGNGEDCYVFAINIPGADVQALQARVLEVGDAWDCCMFAKDVPGADADELLARSESLRQNH